MNSPAMVWWGSSVFKRARKINLAASEKVRIFASDFIRKSSKRYIFVLLLGM